MARRDSRQYYVERDGAVLDDFSTISNWSASTATLAADTTNFKEGTQAMKVSGLINDRVQRDNISPAWDLSAGGVIKLRVFCVNTLNATGTLRIMLSRTPTGLAGDRIRFSFNTTSLHDGWNELVIHTAEDGTTHIQGQAWTSTGTTVDFSEPMQSCALEFIGTDNSTEVSIDAIEFGGRSRPQLVIGFDAIHQSLSDWAFPVMEAAGFKGYIAAEGSATVGMYANATLVAMMETFYKHEWDVINHTENHGSLGAMATAAEIIAEVQPNKDAMIANGFLRGVNYLAYPSGSVSTLAADTLRGMGFIWCRGTGGGKINTSKYGMPNEQWFGSVGFENRSLETIVELTINAAKLYGTTVDVFGHFLNDGPTTDALYWDRNDFSAFIDLLKVEVDAGNIDVVTPTFWKGFELALAKAAVPEREDL